MNTQISNDNLPKSMRYGLTSSTAVSATSKLARYASNNGNSFSPTSANEIRIRIKGDGKAGLSVLITSQKFNGVDTYLRNNMSDIIIFKTNVKNELEAIKNDVMSDLDKDIQDLLLKEAFKEKYGFLYIKNYMPTKDRYYINFKKVVFDEEDADGDDIIIEKED